jgi:predicted RNase H-like HicB family nuclease
MPCHSIVLELSIDTTLTYPFVYLPEFPWQEFVTHGNTYQAAAQNGQEALDGLIAVLQDNDRPLPEPKSFSIA